MNSVIEEQAIIQSDDFQERIKKVVADSCQQAMIECVKKFEAKQNKVTIKSDKVSFWKKIQYICAYLAVILSLVGAFMNWNKEIVAAEISEIQTHKNEKVKLQQEFNKAILDVRVVILNQNILCKLQDRTSEELRVERINSLKKVAVLNSTIRNTYGAPTSMIVSNFVSRVYDIRDVCALDAEENDYELQKLFQQVNNAISGSIVEDNKKINRLIKKRHQLELPIKM